MTTFDLKSLSISVLFSKKLSFNVSSSIIKKENKKDKNDNEIKEEKENKESQEDYGKKEDKENITIN